MHLCTCSSQHDYALACLAEIHVYRKPPKYGHLYIPECSHGVSIMLIGNAIRKTSIKTRYKKSTIQNWGWRGKIVLLSTIHRRFWGHASQQKLLTFLHSRTEEYSKFTEGLGLHLFFLFPPSPECGFCLTLLPGLPISTFVSVHNNTWATSEKQGKAGSIHHVNDVRWT